MRLPAISRSLKGRLKASGTPNRVAPAAPKAGAASGPADRDAFFHWSDAWVFAALPRGTDDSGAVVFSRLIGAADALNHAILTTSELRQALVKLHARGLLDVVDGTATVTPLTRSLLEQIGGLRGGLFAVVDNALRVLESPRTKLPTVDAAPDVGFLTDSLVARAYEEYARGFDRGSDPPKPATVEGGA